MVIEHGQEAVKITPWWWRKKALLTYILGSVSIVIGLVTLLLVGYSITQQLSSYRKLPTAPLKSVEIIDLAGVLDSGKVEAGLREVGFAKPPARVVFLTFDELTAATNSSGDSVNLDSAVLLYARSSHPDWISSKDPSKWADGLLIIANRPSQRKIGLYFGQDMYPVLQSKTGNILSEMKPELRQNKFTEAFLTGLRESAVELNHNAASQPLPDGLVLFSFALAPLSFALLLWLFLRGLRRRTLRMSRLILSNTQRAATDIFKNIAAVREIFKTIAPPESVTPVESGDAAPTITLSELPIFTKSYDSFRRLSPQFPTADAFLRSVGDPSEQVSLYLPDDPRMATAHRVCLELSEVMRGVMTCATVVLLRPGWREVWQREVAGVAQELKEMYILWKNVPLRDSYRGQFEYLESLYEDRDNRTRWLQEGLLSGQFTPVMAVQELQYWAQENNSALEKLVRAHMEYIQRKGSGMQRKSAREFAARLAAGTASGYGIYDYGPEWTRTYRQKAELFIEGKARSYITISNSLAVSSVVADYSSTTSTSANFSGGGSGGGFSGGGGSSSY